jgi:hypothetical protein
MNTVERISVIIPKFKHQLLFLEEREKLFRTDVGSSEFRASSATTTTTQSSSIITSASQSFTTTITNSPILSSPIEPSADCVPKSPSNGFTLNQSSNNTNILKSFPDQYIIPRLPNGLMKDLEAGDLTKFGPHYSNRQVLIDTISFDLTNNYKLL